MQVRIFQLMNQKKKKKEVGASTELSTVAEIEKLEASRQADVKSKKVVRDKVKRLMRQNKLRRVDSILKHASTDEPWCTAVHVKVQGQIPYTISNMMFIFLNDHQEDFPLIAAY